MTAAARSIPEWIPSDTTLTEPMRMPIVSLATRRALFDRMDSAAVRRFCRFDIDILLSESTIIVSLPPLLEGMDGLFVADILPIAEEVCQIESRHCGHRASHHSRSGFGYTSES